MNFFNKTKEGTIVNIRLIPNASVTTILGIEIIKTQNLQDVEVLKIKISAPPHENQANEELIKFLSKKFKIPKSKIMIIKGQKNRDKKILITCDFDMSFA